MHLLALLLHLLALLLQPLKVCQCYAAAILLLIASHSVAACMRSG
jgi:hypothetical protein